MITDWSRSVRVLVVVAVLGVASLAAATPIELKDSNGTRYNVNTAVSPLPSLSEASGALTNATYEQPVTVTSQFVGISSYFGFGTVYTVTYQVNVPLTNAFAGFNGLAIAGAAGQKLPTPIPFNPGAGVASQDCPQSGQNRQLNFQTQALPAQNLQVTRSVYVPSNAAWVRWLNVVTNTGPAPSQVGIALVGRIGSGSSTKVVSTSTGDSSLGAGDLWFTSAQSVPQGTKSLQPRIGYVVQGAGAPTPARNVTINTAGQAGFVYTPTIAPGGTAIVMTFVTVQGSNKQVKNVVQKLVDLPSGSLNCMSEQQLAQVVNFAPVTPPQTSNATITLAFDKTGADTVQWKGQIAIGAGITLEGLPVTVDVGGVTTGFTLNKSGKANNGNGNKFNLAANLKGGVTKAGNVNFSFHLKNALQSALAPFGLTDATASNTPVSVPVTFTAGQGEYATSQAFTYKATAGKSGTAKSS